MIANTKIIYLRVVFLIIGIIISVNPLHAGKESLETESALASYSNNSVKRLDDATEVESIFESDKLNKCSFPELIRALDHTRKFPSKEWLPELRKAKETHSKLTFEAIYGKDDVKYIRGKDYHTPILRIIDELIQLNEKSTLPKHKTK